MKTDRATPGSTVSGATAVLELVNHSRRINLCWFCCSARSLEVRSLPACLPAFLPVAGLGEEVGQEAEGN